jgi:hypothetical protein
MGSWRSAQWTGKVGASLSAARGTIEGLAQARAIGGAFTGAVIAALILAAGAQAEDQATANEMRYQLDGYYHIVYYSPEAFECFRPGNRKNIGLAIAKTQQEIQLLSKPLAELMSASSTSEDVSTVAAFKEMIAHLKDILSRLLRLPPCPEQPAEVPVTPGPPPSSDNTYQNGNGGPDQNGDGGPGDNGENQQDGCLPGSNGVGQGGCGNDQNQQHGMNQSNNHNDGGSGHHNNH